VWIPLQRSDFVYEKGRFADVDDFVNAYIDDILIYSETNEGNVRHTRKVLQALKDTGLHLKPEKCEFNVRTV